MSFTVIQADSDTVYVELDVHDLYHKLSNFQMFWIVDFEYTCKDM